MIRVIHASTRVLVFGFAFIQTMGMIGSAWAGDPAGLRGTHGRDNPGTSAVCAEKHPECDARYIQADTLCDGRRELPDGERGLLSTRKLRRYDVAPVRTALGFPRVDRARSGLQPRLRRPDPARRGEFVFLSQSSFNVTCRLSDRIELLLGPRDTPNAPVGIQRDQLD